MDFLITLATLSVTFLSILWSSSFAGYLLIKEKKLNHDIEKDRVEEEHNKNIDKINPLKKLSENINNYDDIYDFIKKVITSKLVVSDYIEDTGYSSLPSSQIRLLLSDFSTQSKFEICNLKELSHEIQKQRLEKYYDEVYLKNDVFLEISLLFEEYLKKSKLENPTLTKDNKLEFIIRRVYKKIYTSFLSNQDKISDAIRSSRECSYVHKKLEKLDSLPVTSFMRIVKTASLNLLFMGILIPLTLLSLGLEHIPNFIAALVLGYLIAVAIRISTQVKNLLKNDTHPTHRAPKNHP